MMTSIRLWQIARHNPIVAALSIATYLAFTSCGCSGLSCQPGARDARLGNAAGTPQVIERIPAFSVKDITGREISPATLEGKVALLVVRIGANQ